MAETRSRPVKIVRPSIIEAALAEPTGLDPRLPHGRPVIIAYAKGLLKEFPASPGHRRRDPGRLVVAAIIAVAARGPDRPGEPVDDAPAGEAQPYIVQIAWVR